MPNALREPYGKSSGLAELARAPEVTAIANPVWVDDMAAVDAAVAARNDELTTVLWCAIHRVQSTKTLCLSGPSFQAISVALPRRNDLDMQTMRLRTGIALGFVNPLNLEGFQ